MLPLTPEVARRAVDIALERAKGDGTWTKRVSSDAPLRSADISLERFLHELHSEMEPYLRDGEGARIAARVREPVAPDATIGDFRNRTFGDILHITDCALG
jgi:hypothetical protein